MSTPGREILAVLVASLLLGACVHIPPQTVRFTTFNVAMGLEREGELGQRLAGSDDPALQSLASILQTVRPDVVLLNEFDRREATDAAALLQENYLSVSQAGGLEPLDYPWTYSAPVNTGENSGLDLDGDGALGGPGDAWGFGRFPGQYAMLVLSRYPIDDARVRSFRLLPWREMPGARAPVLPDGRPFYPAAVWRKLRLSSKSHWDIPISVGGTTVHFLVSHPTPPVFDGPEDRNGARNHDEIRFWADYVTGASWIVDDAGQRGGLAAGTAFVIAGDQNADPFDGDSDPASIRQLLELPAIDASCEPASAGAVEATHEQGGINQEHRGNPSLDTSDFSDRHAGNLRLDYVLPSAGSAASACGVFWPESGDERHAWIEFSDHRLTWQDVLVPNTY